jgi:hypothetical protein
VSWPPRATSPPRRCPPTSKSPSYLGSRCGGRWRPRPSAIATPSGSWSPAKARPLAAFVGRSIRDTVDTVTGGSVIAQLYDIPGRGNGRRGSSPVGPGCGHGRACRGVLEAYRGRDLHPALGASRLAPAVERGDSMALTQADVIMRSPIQRCLGSARAVRNARIDPPSPPTTSESRKLTRWPRPGRNAVLKTRPRISAMRGAWCTRSTVDVATPTPGQLATPNCPLRYEAGSGRSPRRPGSRTLGLVPHRAQ